MGTADRFTHKNHFAWKKSPSGKLDLEPILRGLERVSSRLDDSKADFHSAFFVVKCRAWDFSIV